MMAKVMMKVRFRSAIKFLIKTNQSFQLHQHLIKAYPPTGTKIIPTQHLNKNNTVF